MCGYETNGNGTSSGETVAREKLKRQIQGLSDESMKELWAAIQGGAFGAPLETGNQVVGSP